MNLTDPHLFRADRTKLWAAIARKVAADPALLAGPLDNISRWLTRGRLHSAPLLEWRELLLQAQASKQGLENLLALLSADDVRAERLKSCSPFPGLLTTEELALCSSSARASGETFGQH